MIEIDEIDRQIMQAMRGLDVFDATFHGAGSPVLCNVARDTHELQDEYGGARVVESAARVSYLRSEVGDPRLGERFEFDGKRYIIEDKIASQDSSWRVAICTVKDIE